MKIKKAKKIAIECMEKELNKIIGDIYALRFQGVPAPLLSDYQDRYAKIADAIKTLQSLPEAML